MQQNISYRKELERKLIHLCALSIPITYTFLSTELILSIIIPLTLCFVILDLLSKKIKFIRLFVFKYFGRMLRSHETDKNIVLNGASWVMISATLCIAAFPKIICITSFSIMIISDISAALIGRRFGKHKIYGKSYEGCAAFILSAIVVVFITGINFQMPEYFFVFGIFASIVGAVVELYSTALYLDDNISIPIAIGSTFLLLNYLFGIENMFAW